MTFRIYATGDGWIAVCVPSSMTEDEVVRAANIMQDSGTRDGFKHRHRHFKDGKSSPCRCNEKPGIRAHWYLEV